MCVNSPTFLFMLSHTTYMCTYMLASSRHSMPLLPMSALQHLHHLHRLRSLVAHPAPALRACACMQVAERVQCSAIIEAGNSAITPDADVVLQRRGIPVLPVRGRWGAMGKRRYNSCWPGHSVSG